MQGRKEEAIAHISLATSLVPSYKGWQSEDDRAFALGDFYLHLGQVYLDMGRRVKGERMINRAIETVPRGRARDHLRLLGEMSLRRVPPHKRKEELQLWEEAMQKKSFDPFEKEDEDGM
jgi:hypothetical protein